ncbi:MAG: hypothetical protein WBB97_03310 [Dehalococcoidales bacterium]
MISPDDPRVQEIIDGAESKAQAINGLFDLGMTKPQIMKLGFKEATVRKEVDRRKREGEDIPGTPPHETPVLPAVTKGTEQVLPEYLSGEISEYFDGSEEQRRIFKAGIMVPLMGMRLFAEMVKPLTMLINAMKGDQMDSMMKALSLGQEQAHTAAMEASQVTAAQILASQKEIALASSPNPMQTMMVQTMQPLISGLLGKMMGTIIPGAPTSGAANPEEGPPIGWTHRTEKTEA